MAKVQKQKEQTKKKPEKQPVYRQRSKKALSAVGLQDVGIDGDPAKRPPNRPGFEDYGPTKKNPDKMEHYKRVCKERLAAVGLKSFSVDPAREKFGEPSPLEEVELEDK